MLVSAIEFLVLMMAAEKLHACRLERAEGLLLPADVYRTQTIAGLFVFVIR